MYFVLPRSWRTGTECARWWRTVVCGTSRDWPPAWGWIGASTPIAHVDWHKTSHISCEQIKSNQIQTIPKVCSLMMQLFTLIFISLSQSNHFIYSKANLRNPWLISMSSFCLIYHWEPTHVITSSWEWQCSPSTLNPHSFHQDRCQRSNHTPCCSQTSWNVGTHLKQRAAR